MSNTVWIYLFGEVDDSEVISPFTTTMNLGCLHLNEQRQHIEIHYFTQEQDVLGKILLLHPDEHKNTVKLP